MDAIEALKTRRSVRKFTSEAVARETIEDLVDCAHQAATANNAQPWEFVVVTTRATLEKLAAMTDYGHFLSKAAASIVVFCKPTDYYVEDGSAATQNLLLAAHAHGLGACWIAGDKKSYAEPVRIALGVPAGFKLVSLVALGHATDKPSAKPKRPLAELLHWEKF